MSTAGYNGQFVFPDLTTYQITVQGIANGLTPAEIRTAGGGASRFNLTAGQPNVSVATGDVGIYVEDEWKVKENLTFDLGLRFERQSAVPDHFDPAPRFGFAWAPGRKGKRSAWLTVRGGGGLFYDRFKSTNILQPLRQNGVTQQAYFVQDPDFYPVIPNPSSLSGVQPTVYRLAPNLRSQEIYAAGLTAERSFGKLGNVSANYINLRGVHLYMARNANAPLPGTYDPLFPDSGVRPLGGSQNIYQYSSDGLSRANIFFANYTFRFGKWLNVWGFYINQHFNSDSGGADTFVSNSYNVAADYGNAVWNVTNRFFTGANIHLPHGVGLEPFLIARGGRRFNITTGSDNNGDTLYLDRPAFATDLNRSSVVRTAFGNFDVSPLASQKIIPWNYGVGPSYISLQLSMSKAFKFGAKSAAGPVTAIAPVTSKDSSASGKPDPPFELDLSVEAQNVFNHVNGSVPVGTLSSSLFGQSLSLESGFSNNNTAANRTINLRAAFRF